jgi:molybdenum cofactor cytidylyltransferase
VTRLDFTPVILLAGGKSSRMGRPKGLVPFQGRPWIEHQLMRLHEVGIREVIIVLGFYADEYVARLSWLIDALPRQGTEAFGLKLRAIVNPLPQYGPYSSIQAGGGNALRLAHAFAQYFWVLPIDVPCPSREVWEALSRSRAEACVPTYIGRGGHPVRLSDSFLRRIRQTTPYGADSRLDRQIHLLGSDADRLEVDDPTILTNLNTPADWESLQA